MEGLKELKLLTWLGLSNNHIKAIDQLNQVRDSFGNAKCKKTLDIISYKFWFLEIDENIKKLLRPDLAYPKPN
jgi:hypothetical protein